MMEFIRQSNPVKYQLEIGDASFDIRPYFFISLAVKPEGYSYIKRKYNEDKWTYFEAYKNSRYRTNPALTCYPIKVEEVLRMLIGIYEVSEETGDFDVLLSIVKQQYKGLYRYVQNKKEFNGEEYTEYMKKRTRTEHLDMRLYMYSFYTAIFLCFHFQKNFILDLHLGTSMIGIARTPNTPENRELHWEQNSENVQNRVKRMQELYYMPLPKNQFNFWEYIRNQMEEVDKKTKLGQYVDRKIFDNIQDRINYFVAFGDLIEAMGIDPIELQNMPLQPSEMRKTFQEYVIHQIEHVDTKIDFNLFVSIHFYLKRLADMYLDAKVRLLDTTEEEKFVFAKEKEQEIKEREDRLLKIEKDSERELDSLREKNQALQDEVERLKKKEQEWAKERQENQKEKKELSALRTFVYRLEQEEKQEAHSGHQHEERLEELRTRQMVFFGGHPNWIQKTKELFPDARFLEVEDLNRKLSFIQNYDVVCINADHFNHAFYAKVMNEVAKFSTQLVYVRGATNQERLVKEIYEQMNL